MKNHKKIWNQGRKVTQRSQRLLSEFLLLCRGNYNTGSTLHNKTVYLYTKRYVIPSVGNAFASDISLVLNSLEDDDLLQEFNLMVLEIIRKYRSKHSSLSIGGYLSYLLPYYVKEFIDRYHRQLNYPIEYNSSDCVFPKNDIENLNKSLIYLNRELGLTSVELGARYMVSPITIRRRWTSD